MHVLKNWYNGHRLVRYVNIGLPPLTIRAKYRSGKTPRIPNTDATVTAVEGMTDVYDICTSGKVGGNWYGLLLGDGDLVEFLDANTEGVTNVKSAFTECNSVQGGAYMMYQKFISMDVVPEFDKYTFHECGSSTMTGSAELEQIPQNWGGNAISFKTVTIGNQTWMAENLAIDDGGSGIYTANVTANGVDFGTQYYYTTGAAERVSQSVDGWHLPNSAEWTTLRNYIGSASAGKILKSTTGWKSNGNGIDSYDFSGIPVGYYSSTTAVNIGKQASYIISGGVTVFGVTDYLTGMQYDYNNMPTFGVKTAIGSIRLVHD